MKKQILIKICLAIFLSFHSFSAQDLLVVSNNGENQALIVEADSLKTVAAIPIGVNPHDIAVSADGNLAYIAIMGTREVPGTTIDVIDLKNRTFKKSINLGKYNRCHDVRASQNRKLIWTTCAESRTVLEIDEESGKILKTWDLADEGAWMLIVTPDERKIYTANLEGKSVSVIDRKTNKVGSIKFQSGQIGIDISPTGREVWVHHIEESKVSVIDTATDKVLATFPSGGKSFGRLKFTPDGKYVLVPQSESKNMAVFDAATRRMIADVPLSLSPKVITVSADSKKAFIGSPPNNKMMVIDLQTFKEINTVPLGKNTDGIAFAKQNKTLSPTAFSIPEKDLIPEGIAYDSVTKSFFVSSTYRRKIVRVNGKGKSSDFTSEAQDGLTGVVGMRVDEKRRILWAISSDAGEGMPMKNQIADERGISKVFKYDLKTGKLLKKYVLDKRPQNNFLNDLTIHPNGDVFISNSRTGEIYSISQTKDELEVFLKLENAQFPNGIDISPDGKFLFMAIARNVAIINVATKQVSLISMLPNQSFWADGLYFYKNSLIAVGVRENRHEVTQYFLNETRDKINGFRTLETAEHPAFLQPTMGVIVGNELFFIANSQLQHFKNLYAENKNFDLQKLREVVVLKTKLY